MFTSPTLADRPFNAILLGPGATRQEQVANARNGSVDSLYATDWNNLAPRLGLTWDPKGSGTMVVRGGAGVSYNRINNTVWTGEWQNPPHFAQASTTHLRPHADRLHAWDRTIRRTPRSRQASTSAAESVGRASA